MRARARLDAEDLVPRPPFSVIGLAEQLLRMLGVASEEAQKLASEPLPDLDFSLKPT